MDCWWACVNSDAAAAAVDPVNGRSIIVLVVLTAAVVAAAVIMRSSQDSAGEAAEGPYFPGLLDRSNEVGRAIIKDGQSTVTIQREGEHWTIAEKAGYPASLDRVRELVLGLARLQRVEGKTTDPERYGKLGLGGIDEPGSPSTLLQLLDGSGGTLAVLIVGNEKPAYGGPRRQMYVRSPGEPQAWLVEGQLPELGAASGWMDTSILGTDPPAFRSVTVIREEETLRVSRENEDTEVYQLEGLADGEEIDSQYAVNQVVRGFRDMVFEDVRPAGESMHEAEAGKVIAEAFDGTRLTLTVNRDGDDYYGRFSAEYGSGSDGNDETPARIDEWNARWKNWEYLLPDYQVENVIVGREDLIRQEGAVEAAQ